MASVTEGLPLVPLSPLSKQYRDSLNAFDQVSQELLEAKKAKPPVSNVVLKQLLEHLQVERKKCTHLESQIHKVDMGTVFMWDPEQLAKQIAIINSQLFSMACLDKKLLCQLDSQTHLTHLIDFHRYLKHSVAHHVIFWPEFQKQGLPATPPVRPEQNVIEHLVRTAYVLVDTYRDYSGFAAIIKALQLPEVRRNNKLWKQCSSSAKNLLQKLTKLVSPANAYEAYHQHIQAKLIPVAQRSSRAVTCIPWIQAHFVMIRTIVSQYSQHHMPEADLYRTIVLSEPGMRQLAQVVSILELCHSGQTSELTDWLDQNPTLASQRHRRQSMIKSKDDAVVLAADLRQLGPGNVEIHHWLVSRVYLTREQLIDESLLVEPARLGEAIVNKDDPEDDIVLTSAPMSRQTTNDTSLDRVSLQNDKDACSSLQIKETELHAMSEQGSTTSTSSTHLQASMDSKQTKKSRLSPTAPEFVPSSYPSKHGLSPTPSAGSLAGSIRRTRSQQPHRAHDRDDTSEKWNGYPSPAKSENITTGDDEEVWTGYPGPTMSATVTTQDDRAESQVLSESSDEEWKGYHASKVEATWQMESSLKVQEHDWQGYTLETLNEDDLDSSTMMNGEFGKPRYLTTQSSSDNHRRHSNHNNHHSTLDIYPSMLTKVVQ